MPKRSSIHRAPQDESQLAKSIVDELTLDVDDLTSDEPELKPEKNLAAVALGRLGGLKGGKARAEKLSPKRRKAIAKKAAQARWSKEKGEGE
jgi:hypothetical protein